MDNEDEDSNQDHEAEAKNEQNLKIGLAESVDDFWYAFDDDAFDTLLLWLLLLLLPILQNYMTATYLCLLTSTIHLWIFD